MASGRVIAIGLDGFELSVAEDLMKAGKLPALAKLKEEGASYLLDHGSARETGLAWEHFSTGKSPDAYRRWSAVSFDPATYAARQCPTRAQPFLASVDAPVVAFDVPYLDLDAAGNVRGMANWGAHDPGVARHANPPSLVAEIGERFGAYPAADSIYRFVWPSAEASDDMATKLIDAVRIRADITSWLLKARLPDWRIAVTVISEYHSAIEALWHGIDPSHPLHGHPSAVPARRGIEGVYVEADRMVARLQEDHPEAAIVVFAMHGMGPNKSDVASMALLPEILYRRRFGRPFLHPRDDWDPTCPMLRPGEGWSGAVIARLGAADRSAPGEGAIEGVASRVRQFFIRTRDAIAQDCLPWMPAAHYARFWPSMDAFALPSFYDGQVRVNLKGRERHGRVAPGDYPALLDDLESMLWGSRDAATGEGVVDEIERPLADDPFADTETRCDLLIRWSRNVFALDVPGIGRVGPVPQRRTGGHTGTHGLAVIKSARTPLSTARVASSFDMVPTILALAGLERPDGLVGASLVEPAGRDLSRA